MESWTGDMRSHAQMLIIAAAPTLPWVVVRVQDAAAFFPDAKHCKVPSGVDYLRLTDTANL